MPARKKDPSARARANKASTAATLDKVVPLEDRPSLPDHHDWSQMTREWWDDLWSAPMAAEYHSSDRHALFLLAALVEDFWTASTSTGRKEAATEIRLQRQAFGLTPYDRRRLEWTIETAEESKDRGRARREQAGAKQPKPTQDPRLKLVQ